LSAAASRRREREIDLLALRHELAVMQRTARLAAQLSIVPPSSRWPDGCHRSVARP
jgi:hypothetical protein